MLVWSKRRSKGIPVDRYDYSLIVGLVIAMTIWVVPNYMVVSEPAEKHELCMMVFVLFVFFAVCMLVQLFLKDRQPVWYVLIKFIGPITCCFLNNYRDGTNSSATYGFLATVNYDIVFMAQGLLDCFFWE